MFKILTRKALKALIADHKAVNNVNNIAVVDLQCALVAYAGDLLIMVSRYFASSPKKFKKSRN